ncbi:hypothetical protein COT75_02605 [Candidatus Beckwithbacteria bacterium CG10_big_fil_rev_8_21_14_0_10_34_10]|uniref:Uncharacterized protein n=1 Tax=Candidatus Beckwithbacteria bacterium CG10_big_fil_rev_8_21_14_0_10_34_10 TaxID=1974495 RepID=A0A2H0W994_9BACT|nr:MAG: hypothetical protein COT75_02605 [Candidatus Beckwithbacteria bacterium CG10_big_fil_rev_8_21_14_0_10_34_10]
MKKIFKIIFINLLFLAFYLVIPKKALGAMPCDGKDPCSLFYPGLNFTINPQTLIEDQEGLNVIINGLASGKKYDLYVDCAGGNDYNNQSITASGNNDKFIWQGYISSAQGYRHNCYNNLTLVSEKDRYICLIEGNSSKPTCVVGSYQLISKKEATGLVNCNYTFNPSYPAVEHLENTTLTITDLEPNERYSLVVSGPGIEVICTVSKKTDSSGNFIFSDLTHGEDFGLRYETCIQNPGDFEFTLEPGSSSGFLETNICEFEKRIYSENEDPLTPPEGLKESVDFIKPKECCILKDSMCQDLRNPVCMAKCQKKGIETAFGCFPTDPAAIIDWILRYSLMLSGGIGFLVMLVASFMVMTSAGDPEKLKAGQELLGSAIIGILFIAFSLFILRFIGASILKIPGWG